jgi:hypothetical protein
MEVNCSNPSARIPWLSVLFLNAVKMHQSLSFQAEAMARQVELENMYEDVKRERDQLLEQNRRVRIGDFKY